MPTLLTGTSPVAVELAEERPDIENISSVANVDKPENRTGGHWIQEEG